MKKAKELYAVTTENPEFSSNDNDFDSLDHTVL